MRFRSISRVLRVNLSKASTLRWLKYESSSWASSSITSIRSLFFFLLTKGEEGPTLAGGSKVFLENKRPSERPSSSPKMQVVTHLLLATVPLD